MHCVGSDLFQQCLDIQHYSQTCVKLSFKGLVNLQKTFLKLLLIKKLGMRETECRKPRQKFQNSFQVMKVSKFN